MVQLDADATPDCADRDVGIEAPVLDPQVVEMTKRLPGEETQLWMMALGLKFGDDDDGQHHPVLSEPSDSCRVREQDTGVQDVSAASPARPDNACSLARPVGTRQPGGGGRHWLRSQGVRCRCGSAC